MAVDENLADDQWRRYCYCRDRGHLDFTVKADKCDKFVVGEQWAAADLQALRDKGLPALTINKLLATISNIQGEQVMNRTEVLFRPTTGAPPEVADALSKVWMQISQNNQLPWVRSDVFADGIVRSRGFYDVRMSYEDSQNGEVAIRTLNSKNVIIDPDACEYDPDNWNDVFTTNWFSFEDIAILYNEEDANELKARSGVTRYGYDSVDRFRDSFAGNRQNVMQYRADVELETRRNIRVIERQYRKLDKMMHFVDVETGDMRPIPSTWDRNRIALFIEKMNGQVSTIKKLIKRIRWTVTADNLVLHDDWSPYKHFTVVPYFPHFRYGRTTGIVENLIGPQEILNKVSSQELHIVNTTANSGYIVEENSLVNMSVEELELKGATTGIVLEYRKNTQPPQKIQPNQPPSGLERISMKAEEQIKTISGVSDSMMGFDRADVAAKAIAYKQQRGSVSLAKILDNLERTDWLLARNVLDLIQEFYTDERLVTITNENFANDTQQVTVNQANPVTGEILNDLTLGEYSIVITSSPYRSSLEDSQFDQAKALREIGVQLPDSILIENSRLLRRGEIVKQLQAAASSPQAQQQQQLNMRGQEAQVAKIEAEVEKTQANAQMLAVKAQKDAQPEQVQQEDKSMEIATLQFEKWKFEQELALRREEMDKEFALKERQMERETNLKRVEALRKEAQPLPKQD